MFVPQAVHTSVNSHGRYRYIVKSGVVEYTRIEGVLHVVDGNS